MCSFLLIIFREVLKVFAVIAIICSFHFIQNPDIGMIGSINAFRNDLFTINKIVKDIPKIFDEGKNISLEKGEEVKQSVSYIKDNTYKTQEKIERKIIYFIYRLNVFRKNILFHSPIKAFF